MRLHPAMVYFSSSLNPLFPSKKKKTYICSVFLPGNMESYRMRLHPAMVYTLDYRCHLNDTRDVPLPPAVRECLEHFSQTQPEELQREFGITHAGEDGEELRTQGERIKITNTTLQQRARNALFFSAQTFCISFSYHYILRVCNKSQNTPSASSSAPATCCTLGSSAPCCRRERACSSSSTKRGTTSSECSTLTLTLYGAAWPPNLPCPRLRYLLLCQPSFNTLQ
jgi:hypothetical protein